MKNKGVAALFITLVIILAVNPRFINNIHNSILGRFFLVAMVVFFARYNMTLGLLFALVIISASNQFTTFVEGMDNNSRTIGDDTSSGTTGTQPVVTTDSSQTEKINQLKAKLEDAQTQLQAHAEAAGISKEDVKNAIASKQSNSIPVDKSTMSSENVSAHTPGMVRNSSTLTEGFCPCAASVF
jgi:hypothetical protein